MVEIPAKVVKFLGSARMSTLLKVVVLSVAFAFIYVKLNGLSDFLGRSKSLFMSSWRQNPWTFIGVLFLFPANYLLEAVKWKWLLKKLAPISTFAALKGVFSGLTLGFITPHSIGDYAGRILFLPQHLRIQTIIPLFIGRFSQFLVTVLSGSLALTFLYITHMDVQLFDVKILALILGVFIACPILLFGLRKSIKGLLLKWLPAGFVQQLSSGAESYTVLEIGIALMICLGRYAVFVGQYLLLLIFFGFPGPLHLLLLAVALIFFAKSTLPTFNFMSDLGVREFAALIFLGYTHMSNDSIVLASLTLWFINILFPTIIGLYFVQEIKLLDKR